MSREWSFYVYIMSSLFRRIYTGVTNDIFRRTLQHERGEIDGFTKRYNINRLVPGRGLGKPIAPVVTPPRADPSLRS